MSVFFLLFVSFLSFRDTPHPEKLCNCNDNEFTYKNDLETELNTEDEIVETSPSLLKSFLKIKFISCLEIYTFIFKIKQYKILL